MLPLESQHWARHADDHAIHYNHEMAKFVSDLALSLRCQSVFEAGCSAGNDLRLLPGHIPASGIDISEHAVSKARENLPKLEFKVGSVTSIPYGDESFDFVFTRNTLNHLADSDVQSATDELLRVAKKYVMNIELFSEDESALSGSQVRTAGRNMRNRWLDYSVKIISNVDMHEEIDSKKSRFTLVRKIR